VKTAALRTTASAASADLLAVAPEENAQEAAYHRQLRELQQVQQRSAVVRELLDKLRTDYGSTNDAQERQAIAAEIVSREQMLSRHQRDMQQLSKQIQDLEIALLSQGIVPTAGRPAVAERNRLLQASVQAALSPRPEKIIN
jgi:HD-GYP domain-containing protein (c-di-GMP phosphodiesterase class II)